MNTKEQDPVGFYVATLIEAGQRLTDEVIILDIERESNPALDVDYKISRAKFNAVYDELEKLHEQYYAATL